MSKNASKTTSSKSPSKKAKRVAAPSDPLGIMAGLQAIAQSAPAADVMTTLPAAEPAAAPVVKAPALKAERVVQNGVKRPAPGGLCAQVWDALDSMHAAGVAPSSKDVRDLSTAKGWNESNSLCELSAWRKFMGLSKPHNMKPKRKTVAKVAAPAVRMDGEVDQQTA